MAKYQNRITEALENVMYHVIKKVGMQQEVK